MWIEESVVTKWRAMSGDRSIETLKDMVNKATPITHPLGNHRYNDFVFMFRKSTVVDVAWVNSCKPECEFCGGCGYTMMEDVRVPCHVCEEYKQTGGLV